jgi:hypothetical protein
MNYTKSGIIATGAPNSRVRFLKEAELGLEHPSLLLLTDEGKQLADRFLRSLGCEPSEMPEDLKSEYLNTKRELYQFLVGVIFSLNLP